MKAKDIDVLHAFYVSTRRQLYTYAVSITADRESAEDVVHDVLERLLRLRDLPADLRPYVFRAVRNAALDSRRRVKVSADWIFEADPTTDDTTPPARPDRLESLLHELPFDERDAIVLKLYSGLTFQEIADLRDLPLPTVASWYRRGLERLRGLLTEEYT
jgi:RNA polymerase sigma-70 factor (ECF subfamily)